LALCLLWAAPVLFAQAATPLGPPDEPAGEPLQPQTLPWLTDLKSGHRQALADGKPVLLRVGAEWCLACRQLEGEIKKAELQAELARWTLVYLDADRSAEDLKELNVTTVPALRVRTPGGQLLESRDGYLSAGELAAWLKQQYAVAVVVPDAVLLGSGEPDTATVRRLVRQFDQRDPVVREISLRGLQNLGGSEATAALVKLLEDPEPNVRAAVLKQLEGNPQPAMVPKIAAYLEKEQDPDLIVHAIRFLRAAGGPGAIRSLIPLLKHESWQVRAEAAAGVGGMDTSFATIGDTHSGLVPVGIPFDTGGDGDPSTNVQADAIAALVELLDDPHAFVVSRAVEGLANSGMTAAVEPLIRAAEKHPDLTLNIVEMLAGNGNLREEALPHLRAFCKHADPMIRAAAIRGLTYAGAGAFEDELVAGLEDDDATVRIAATVASQLANDVQLSDEFRRDAFRVMLLTQETNQAITTVIAALSDPDGQRRQFAMIYLTGEASQLRNFRGAFYLDVDVPWYALSSNSGKFIIPEPPVGLKAAHVRPLIDDPDPQIATRAGYLLALFDEPEGLDVLLRYWNGQGEEDALIFERLVYRAIAKLDDASQISVLRKIYERLEQYEVSEFYWTIRIMSGREILLFRDEIREKVGMRNLR